LKSRISGYLFSASPPLPYSTYRGAGYLFSASQPYPTQHTEEQDISSPPARPTLHDIQKSSISLSRQPALPYTTKQVGDISLPPAPH
jgi:hypothetical protein